MRNFILILIFLCLTGIAFAQNYNVYQPGDFDKNKLYDADEKILFILDFSGSMDEYLGKEKKVTLMLKTMSQILPFIDKKKQVGLRVYGNRQGFTQYDACKASSLLVPITPASAAEIEMKLAKTHPKGMTPITYSLNKAVYSDFLGFSGQKHIILLTDGGENCDESPCLWAMELIKTRSDVKIDVIAFNIDDQDDLDQLKCAALVTTGKFYSAKTAAELVDSLRKSLSIRKDVEAKIILNK
ncbi:MAG TPA: VWA domain-containing protein [Candidatus Gastranaerophilaceae bacterium]|nr:VWA domain-containing protein [Candidatus Gastranaerophilaceae bacterium]HPT41540.1 VWA domain-containing protein [Candidatus Gastranaerophilaceae bacterium]